MLLINITKKTIIIKQDKTFGDLLTEIRKNFVLDKQYIILIGKNIEQDILELFPENEKLTEIFDKNTLMITLKIVSTVFDNKVNQTNNSPSPTSKLSFNNTKNIPTQPNQSTSQVKGICVSCKCNSKTPATNVCFKCNCYICELCKNRNPHVNHQHDIIKLQKAKEHSKNLIEKLGVMIEENVLKDENFKIMKTFECDLEGDIETINTNFNGMKILLEEIKDLQINFLVELHKKMEFGDRFNEINKNLEDITKSLNNFKNSEADLDEILNYIQNSSMVTEKLILDYKNLSNPFKVYSNSIESLDVMNSQFIKYFKEKIIIHQSNYSVNTINSKLSSHIKRKIIN